MTVSSLQFAALGLHQGHSLLPQLQQAERGCGGGRQQAGTQARARTFRTSSRALKSSCSSSFTALRCSANAAVAAWAAAAASAACRAAVSCCSISPASCSTSGCPECRNAEPCTHTGAQHMQLAGMQLLCRRGRAVHSSTCRTATETRAAQSPPCMLPHQQHPQLPKHPQQQRQQKHHHQQPQQQPACSVQVTAE